MTGNITSLLFHPLIQSLLSLSFAHSLFLFHSTNRSLLFLVHLSYFLSCPLHLLPLFIFLPSSITIHLPLLFIFFFSPSLFSIYFYLSPFYIFLSFLLIYVSSLSLSRSCLFSLESFHHNSILLCVLLHFFFFFFLACIFMVGQTLV